MAPDSSTPSRVTIADLTEGKWRARFKALALLPADAVVPAELHAALVGLLAAPEAEQRAKAVAVMARVGAPIVPLLVAVLADEASDADARRAVVVALGQLGPAARAAAPLLCDLTEDPWLGPCARAALDAIEPPRGGFLLLCAAVAVAALLAIAFLITPASGFNPIAAVAGAVGLCIAIGLWWTRPGAAGAVLVFAVVLATATAAWVVSGAPNVFAEVSRVLQRP